jgi:hypothetical protein
MNKNKLSLAALVAGLASAPTHALDWTFGDWSLRSDTKITAGVGVRTESRADDLVGIGNGGTMNSTNYDDGDLAFDPGDVVISALKLNTDLSVTYGEWGVFARAKYLFDPMLSRKDDFFNEANYNPPNAAREAPRSEFEGRTDAVQAYTGRRFQLLDAYAFGNIPLGFTDVAIKVGRQVINWGESTLVLNGINSNLVYDAYAVHVPGWELNEVILPTNNLLVSLSPFTNISLEAFYQLDFQETRPNPAGSYWSVTDFVGIGGARANLNFGLVPENAPGTTTPRVDDKKPGSSGQFGGKLGFFIPPLNDMSLSVVAMNYHSRLPVFSGTSSNVPLSAFGGNYFAEYPKDIQLYGVSFNTTIDTVSVQGEYSLKHGQPLQLDAVELLMTGLGIPSQINPVLGDASGNKYIRGWRRHDVSQVDLGLTYLFGPSSWNFSEQTLLIAEVAATYIHGLPDPEVLAYQGPGNTTPAPDSPSAPVLAGRGLTFEENNRYPTPASWGYRVISRWTYNNVLDRFTLEPALVFQHDVKGTTPEPLGNFVEDRIDITPALGLRWGQAWEGALAYTVYLGGKNHNLLRDRDFAQAFVRYSF